MFKLKNGILYKNEKPVFCVGLSYYPSFHERKVPVPKDGDRVGEMKKDLSKMKQEGFNLVRVAAIGAVKRINGNVEIKTDFIDELLAEADKINIATMVRLQGYSMNLSGHNNFYMIDETGKQMDTTIWYDFIQNSLYHKGILQDNDEGTKCLSHHYSQLAKNLVAYQTYNEPHYPAYATFDYHPETVKAYKKWLVDNELMTEEQAENYYPPTSRPQKDEDPTEWINWRMFAFESMANFLNHTADVSKSVDKDKSSLTCLTSAPSYPRNIYDGVCYFDNARGMDIVGLTNYVNSYGAPYFQACFLLDCAESAAAAYGKHAWLAEYDARTDITLKKFYSETYLAVGAGLKGIMYYQWRADYVFPDSPEGNGFGFINYDATPTKNYDEKMAMIKLLNKLSDKIVNAEKKRCSVAILYSTYAFCYADAVENGAEAKYNSVLNASQMIYKELRREGITVDFTKAELLSDNKLNIDVLYIPSYEFLSKKEKDMVSDFVKRGKKVYCFDNVLLYSDITEEYDRNNPQYNISDTLKINRITPIINSNNSNVLVQVLEGYKYYLATLNNISVTEDTYYNVKLELNKIKAEKAYWYTPVETTELQIINGTVIIPSVKEGGFLLLTY